MEEESSLDRQRHAVPDDSKNGYASEGDAMGQAGLEQVALPG